VKVKEIEERRPKQTKVDAEQPGKGISAVDTPTDDAYNLYRCDKYLIFFNLVGGCGVSG
jgi:hypothetical protein